MKPLQAYKNTRIRAERFLLLYHGLVNVRKRRIRADWKHSFSKIMHWNCNSNIERIDSRDALIILRESSRLSVENFDKVYLEDLLRGALVFIVSAFDKYVHERVSKRIITSLKKGIKNKQQKELALPTHLVLELTERIKVAHKKGEKLRPANEVRNEVQNILYKKPFQSWREIEYAFQLVGINDLDSQLRQKYGVATLKPIKDKLNKLAHRRNQIVHEGDLARHKRGGKERLNKITPKEVKGYIDFLNDLVMKLEGIS